jgi:exonuclease III
MFCTRYLGVLIAWIDSKRHLLKKCLYLTFMCRKGKNCLVAYENKLTFMRFLYARLKQLTSENRFVILLGDFNIFATDQDLYNTTANMWMNIVWKPQRNATLSSSLGYTDFYAFYYPLSQFCLFTRWQHYLTQQDQKNGYRIDLIILPTSSLPYVTDTAVHTAYRALPDSNKLNIARNAPLYTYTLNHVSISSLVMPPLVMLCLSNIKLILINDL